MKTINKKALEKIEANNCVLVDHEVNQNNYFCDCGKKSVAYIATNDHLDTIVELCQDCIEEIDDIIDVVL